MNFDFIIEWGILILFLLFMIYTLFIIGEEKNTFLDHAVYTEFKGLSLQVPHWWTPEESESTLSYTRTDTRYEWKASFTKLSSHLTTPLETLNSIVEENKIKMDPDSTDILQPTKGYRILDFIDVELARIEGTGTQDETERIYLDAFVLKVKKDFYYFESKSSVLNGMVEGPYFEEVVQRLELLPHKKINEPDKSEKRDYQELP